MMSNADDEALRWEGDETTVVNPVAAPATEAPDADDTGPDDEQPSRISSVLLVAYGIFGGIYLLYIVGWIIAVRRSTYSNSNLFSEIMYQLGEFLAIASPAIWLATVLLVTRNSKAVVRVIWLVLGLVLLAPWPFILGSAS